jgi:hypothetical protein
MCKSWGNPDSTAWCHGCASEALSMPELTNGAARTANRIIRRPWRFTVPGGGAARLQLSTLHHQHWSLFRDVDHSLHSIAEAQPLVHGTFSRDAVEHLSLSNPSNGPLANGQQSFTFIQILPLAKSLIRAGPPSELAQMRPCFSLSGELSVTPVAGRPRTP